MIGAINFFDKIDVNAMRKCFYDNDDGGPPDEMRRMIESDMSGGRLAVYGHDFLGHSIHVVFPETRLQMIRMPSCGATYMRSNDVSRQPGIKQMENLINPLLRMISPACLIPI